MFVISLGLSCHGVLCCIWILDIIRVYEMGEEE